MPSVEDYLANIKAAEERGDPDALDEARRAYIEVAPSTPEATDARYRLGLSALFREKDTNKAMALFKEAAQDKTTEVAKEARISYALLLHAKAKRQQAVFELRKLCPQGAKPSMHTATALDFLSLILRETGAQAAEIDKVETTRRAHLQALVDGETDPVQRAHWMLRLGAAYADGESHADIGAARKLFSDVVKLGAKAGESAVKAAKASLKALPR